MNWKLTEEGFNKDKIACNGNKYLIGNGYMGIRGTLEEYEKENLVAVNLSGIYDKVDDLWREPLNAPNGFFGYLEVDGKVYKLPDIEPEKHLIQLDYRHGVFRRSTIWTTSRGEVTLDSERFVSMKDVHLGVMKYSVKANFHADIRLVAGIDADVWDINGPHYDSIVMEGDDMLTVNAVTHENKYNVSVVADEVIKFPCEKKIIKEDNKILKTISFVTDIDKRYTVEKFFSIYTTKDTENTIEAAKEQVKEAVKLGYETELSIQFEEWERIWNSSEIMIEGDDKAMEALNYSCYHLNSIAPRHAESLSIGARGLSGQTYKGAVFWDTEMFMMDFFLMTNPRVAKRLIKHRIDTLEGAKSKAKSYGYPGAFYAWESQEGGFDACSDYNVTDVFTKRPMRTFFKDKQVHISAAVVYGIGRYIELTGDNGILSEGGAETIIECAKFYYGLLFKKVSEKYYEILDVIGPDEYHERVNNNGYTNRMAKYTFEQAIKVMETIKSLDNDTEKKIKQIYDIETLKKEFKNAYCNLYIPQPDERGIIPQFDGYFDLEDVSVEEVKKRIIDPKEYWGGAYGVAAQTQVIKQADVVTWLTLFPKDVSEDQLLNNWKYYEPRTEHGSSLSACMYSLLACRVGMKENAYPLFMKSASADLEGEGKEWAGLVYIGGTHPAAAGGAYMVAIRGFAGVYFEKDQIKVKPKLPDKWKKMSFHIHYKGRQYKVIIENERVDIQQKK